MAKDIRDLRLRGLRVIKGLGGDLALQGVVGKGNGKDFSTCITFPLLFLLPIVTMTTYNISIIIIIMFITSN